VDTVGEGQGDQKVRPEPQILAIDLGTSGVKLALVSATTGRIADRQVEPLTLNLLPGGGAEQDPDEWWAAIARGTRVMLARGTVAPADVVGIGASVQWAGTVAIGEDGRHLHPAIIWMDSRGAPQIKRIVDGVPRVSGYAVGKLMRWIRLTGGAPGHSGKDPIAHILHMRAEMEDVYHRTEVFLEPINWLGLRLTGRPVASFDSITLHWVTDSRDISNVTYSERLLGMSGLNRAKLPDLVPSGSLIGTLTKDAAAELGLDTGVQVAAGMGDLLAAAVGSGAVRDFEAHLCLGTSSWLVGHVPYKKTDLFHNMASLPSGIPGRYLLTNEQESAGVCLQTLKDNMLRADSYDELFAEAAHAPPGSNGLLFTPWINGERSPVDDRLIRGGFSNQSLETSRGDMVRAVLEGVAYNSRWLRTYVEKFIKQPLGPINVIGGGSRSDLWCQIHADVLDRPIRRVEDPMFAGARGAAFQAAVALGHLTWDRLPQMVPIDRTFEPDQRNRELYRRGFEAFLELYKRTRKIHARLNAGELGDSKGG
jgi:xylulokinase